MIALIEREFVQKKKWINEVELYEIIAVAEYTPGPIAVNIATFVGQAQGGFFGSLVATIGMVLPAFIIILIIATVFHNFAKMKYVKAAFEGITPVIWGLIISTGILLVVYCLYANYNNFDEKGQFNFHALAIAIIVGTCMIVYKLIKKKSMPPIATILLAGLCGMIYFI